MPTPKKKTLKVKFATYASNGDDGGVQVILYANRRLAKKAAAKDGEPGNGRFDEDIEMHTLEIDPETGEIVSGVETTVEEDDE